MKKLVSLSFAVGTIVTQKHIDAVKEEANEYPVGSKPWKLFMNYVSRLEEKVKKQNGNYNI
jgi:hypothetical protein